MNLLSRFRSWLRATLHRSRMESEMDAELRTHIEAYAEDLGRQGVPRSEAMRRARLEFGGIDRAKEECREARGARFLETFAQDLRYGVRMLRKSPGFTAVAVLTLALGIGANTAVFSVVYAVLLRPLPYKDSSRLVVLNETTPMVGTVSVSYLNFLDWRAGSRAFSQMAAVHSVSFNLAGIAQPENISGDAVSPNFLSMMGIRPFLGRDFDASEEKPGTAPVLLLSYSFWQSHLGGDPSAVGKTITLDGHGFTIVGILPADYRAPDKTDVLLPIGVWAAQDSDANERGGRGDMVVVGRLTPGVTFAQARAEMEGIAARLAKEYPASNDRFGVALQPIRDAFVGDMKPAILVLFGAVLFVLLIACANVANLFLARGAGRTKEIALRMAFGASRGRILRQMLTESFVLAFLGGGLGVALAIGGIHGLRRLIPANMIAGPTVDLNGAVLLFAAGVVALTAFVFGLAPAAHSANPDVQTELKEGARTASAGAKQNRLRGILAVAEVSLALILLVGAGLMMKSLYRLMNVNPGFRPDRLLTMRIDLRTQQYSTKPALLNFWQEVLARVRALPGVEGAALGTAVPLTDSHSRTDITVEGMELPSPGNYPHPDIHMVSPGYVGTLGIPLLRGRDFTGADTQDTPRVALVNEMLARRFFPNEDPIGKRFIFGHPSAKNPPTWFTIAGVVGDTKLYGLANPARLATMKQLADDSVATPWVTLVLLGVFSGLALVLGAIGIYGVISYSVAQRTREIGIRVALGALRGDVFRLVVGQGLKLAGIGIIAGIAAAFGLARLISSLLYQVSATDLETFAGVAILLVLVALLACYVPARRAMRVDPTVALRYE